MQPLFTMFRQLSQQVVVLSLVAVLSLVGLLTVAVHPSFAATPSRGAASQAISTEENEAIQYKKESYDELADEAKNPKAPQKEFEENLKTYKQEAPTQGGVVENAKEALEKVTQQE